MMSDAGVVILGGREPFTEKSCEDGVPEGTSASARSASALRVGLAVPLRSGPIRAKAKSASAPGDAAGLRKVREVASEVTDGRYV